MGLARNALKLDICVKGSVALMALPLLTPVSISSVLNVLCFGVFV